MTAARQRGLVLTLLLVATVWVGTLSADRAPASRPADAAPSEFSGARARALLQRLVGDNLPHPLGSAANQRMRERIVALLRELGLTPELQSGVMVCSAYGACGTPTNILARIEGTDAGNARAVLLVAHYDSVAAGPGASDNAAGVATVLDIARILLLLPRPRQSIILLLDDGEEPGLLGAQAFVQHHRWAASVTAAVNLDARGTAGPSMMFETGNANRWLMGLYAAAVSRPLTNSLYYAVYKLLPNDTDFSVFKAAGLQGFNFAFIDDVAHYHTPLDDLRHADADSLQHQGDNALSTLLALANAAAAPPPTGEAVYFDLFARLLVRIPLPWVWPAATIVLLLILICGVRLLQLQLLRWRALLWGSFGIIAALAIGAAAAIALMELLRMLGALGAADAPAHARALQASFSGLAFLITALAGAWLGRRAGFWGLWYPGSLLCALGAVALARWLPGASYVALLPAIAALLVLIPALLGGSAACQPAAWLSSAELAALAVCVATFVLVLPIAVPLYGALGGGNLPLLTLLVIYSALSLAALVAIAPPRVQRRLIEVTALWVSIGLLAATLLPRYTAESPQRLNLRYELNADTQQAHWVAVASEGGLPASLRRAAAFVGGASSMLPWQIGRVWAAPAPPLSLPAPVCSLLGVQRAESGRLRYRVHIGSPRAAAVIALAFPAQARVGSLRLEGTTEPGSPDQGLAATPWRLSRGWSQLRLLGLPPEGQDLSFEAAGPAFDLQLFDESYGLPAQGMALQSARPRVAVPSQDGDVTIVMRAYRLQP
jgi:hypothetical protein